MVTKIWRDEVQRLLLDEGAQLVEVLPPPEFEAEHIEGAINIPLKNLDANPAIVSSHSAIETCKAR